MTTDPTEETLGEYLKRTRLAIPLSLRAVEKVATGVTNGYLSQIESGQIKRPSPDVLHALSKAYGVDYRGLLIRARHPVPSLEGTEVEVSQLAGIPVQALSDLTPTESKQVVDYIAWLKTRR